MNAQVELNEVQRAVGQLREDGYGVRFTHWRQTHWGNEIRYSRKVRWMWDDGSLMSSDIDNTAWEFVPPESKGGATRCSILYHHDDDTEELVTESHTTCSKDDQFCYAQGRRISLARAIKQMVESLPYLDAEVYNPLRGELWRNTRSGLR